MDALPNPQLSHFLNLPTELRIEIYNHIFKDNLDRQLEILSFKQYLPCSAITAVNRQIRSECLALFEEAKANIGDNHRWIFCIDARFSSKGYRKNLARESASIPPRICIRSLFVVFEFPCTHYGPRAPIEFRFGVNPDGLPEFWLMPTASIVLRYRTTVLENVLEATIARRLRLGPPLELAYGNPQCIDVGSCIRAFFDIFDDVPFFSSLEFWEY